MPETSRQWMKSGQREREVEAADGRVVGSHIAAIQTNTLPFNRSVDAEQLKIGPLQKG